MSDDVVIPAGNSIHFKVSLRYYYYGTNTNIFDTFTGDSEKDAVKNLKNYIKKCNELHGRYVPIFALERANNPSETVETEEKVSGRGAHFVGTMWVANFETGDKKRIKSEEFEAYQAKGYVKAGPRTKI